MEEPEPQVDTQQQEAEEKMDEMVDMFKELRDYITDLKNRNGDFDAEIAEAEELQTTARDLREEAERQFENGDYEKAIFYAGEAMAIADKYVDIQWTKTRRKKNEVASFTPSLTSSLCGMHS